MNGKLTKNPLNVLHTPGGSSSGSAAAVADYQVPIAIGTQTFGSIARPASFVGIYGYKPTWNVVSMGGSRTFAPSLDTIGFFTRTVDDQEMLADSLKIQDIRESSYNGLKGAKFAVCKPSAAVWSKASPDALKSIQLASELLEAEGATVQDLVLPTDFDKWQEWHLIIACKELETHLLAETSGPTGRTGIDRTIAGFLDIAKKTSLADYVEALDGYRRLMVLFDELASGYDGILTLSAPGEAPRGLEWTGDSSFCTLWTVSGAHVCVCEASSMMMSHITYMSRLLNISLYRHYMFPSSTYLDLAVRTRYLSVSPSSRVDTETDICSEWQRMSAGCAKLAATGNQRS